MGITTYGYSGIRVKIRKGWEDAGREGELFGSVKPDRGNSQEWAILIWDNEDEPELFKLSGLQYKYPGDDEEDKWRDFK
jgi:hypothetical protein